MTIQDLRNVATASELTLINKVEELLIKSVTERVVVHVIRITEKECQGFDCSELRRLRFVIERIIQGIKDFKIEQS